MIDKALTTFAGILTAYFTTLFVIKNYKAGDKSFTNYK